MNKGIVIALSSIGLAQALKIPIKSIKQENGICG